jgi:hypothetical protein
VNDFTWIHGTITPQSASSFIFGGAGFSIRCHRAIGCFERYRAVVYHVRRSNDMRDP